GLHPQPGDHPAGRPAHGDDLRHLQPPRGQDRDGQRRPDHQLPALALRGGGGPVHPHARLLRVRDVPAAHGRTARAPSLQHSGHPRAPAGGISPAARPVRVGFPARPERDRHPDEPFVARRRGGTAAAGRRRAPPGSPRHRAHPRGHAGRQHVRKAAGGRPGFPARPGLGGYGDAHHPEAGCRRRLDPDRLIRARPGRGREGPPAAYFFRVSAVHGAEPSALQRFGRALISYDYMKNSLDRDWRIRLYTRTETFSLAGCRPEVDMTRPFVAPVRLVAALLLVLAGSGPLLAQRSDRGIIGGVVADPQGSGIPGATVSIRNEATGVVTDLTTNSAGAYTTA